MNSKINPHIIAKMKVNEDKYRALKECNTPKIKLTDPELILSCAFRYALGRRTYIVSTVVSEILNNWEQINPHVLERFKKEILEHKEVYKEIGMACDEQEWMSIVNKPINHISNIE